MSQYIIDKTYLGMISNRLRNVQYKNTKSIVLSFSHSCERHDSRKRRGYFLEHKGSLIFKCHNCGLSMSFGNFLKETDSHLAKEYRLALFKAGVFGDYKEPTKEIVTEKKLEPVNNLTFSSLISYKNIPTSNPARRYLDRRLIPPNKINTLFIAPKFYSWAKQFDSVFSNFKDDVPRLVIPYYAEDKTLLGFACRAFGKESPKYIQLRIDKNREFIYGADKIDSTKPIIAVEGQIDSMFLENAVAMGTANYNSDYLSQHKDNVIIVPDNDFRRNPHVCSQLKKAINSGFKICLLPDSWKKDINDNVKSGIDRKDIMDYILSNHKQGAEALLEFTLEKRC